MENAGGIGRPRTKEAGCLPTTYSVAYTCSRADSTTKKYARSFQRWKEWAEPRREVAIYPVQEVHFALYLQHLGDTTKSRAAVDEAVNAINWVHRLSGLPLVSGSPFVGAVQAGLQRVLAKPRTRKEPVTSDMLRSLVDSLSHNPSLSDVRLVASAVLAYAAFLRFDELAKLRCRDVVIENDKMSIHIASSKTDQYRQGDTILVSRTGTATCPVAILERYISTAEIDLAAETHLFRGIVHTKNKERLRPSGSVSYTRMRELFLTDERAFSDYQLACASIYYCWHITCMLHYTTSGSIFSV